MKNIHWIFLIVVLVLGALGGGIAMMHPLAAAQAARIAELEQAEADRQRADAAALRLSAPLACYTVSSPAGVRQSPMGGGEIGLHEGADLVGLPARPRQPVAVLAAADGVVVDHYPAPGTPHPSGGVYAGHPVFGGYIVIDHGGGVYTLYGHLAATKVHIGWRVERGQPIGVQGSTGQSRGEHLHFEVVVDPEAALQGRIPQGRQGGQI